MATGNLRREPHPLKGQARTWVKAGYRVSKPVTVVDWFENHAGGTARELSDNNQLAKQYLRRGVPLRIDMNRDDVVLVQLRDGSYQLVHDSELK